MRHPVVTKLDMWSISQFKTNSSNLVTTRKLDRYHYNKSWETVKAQLHPDLLTPLLSRLPVRLPPHQ